LESFSSVQNQQLTGSKRTETTFDLKKNQEIQ
jgi:hypothetical protein